MLALFAAFIQASRGHLRLPPTGRTLILVTILALTVNLAEFAFDKYADKMPTGATLPYPAFIATRYVTLLGFIAFFSLTYSAFLHAHTRRIFQLLFLLTAALLTLAVYIYIAQTFGFWEPPRTRLGTGGQDYITEEVEFNYAFHRAVGTFREPSHLARWLVAPFLLAVLRWRTYSKYGRASVIYAVIGCAIIIPLSGSLLGLLALTAGLLSYVVIRPTAATKRLFLAAALFFAATIGLELSGISDSKITSTLNERFVTLFQEGVGATNRADAWIYITTQSPPFFGHGLGNANIRLSEFQRNWLLSSHMSIYSNAYFSLGIVGLCMITWVTLAPVIHAIRIANVQRMILAPFLAPCIAWIVIFAGGQEEFQLLYGLILGLFWATVAKIGKRSSPLRPDLPSRLLRREPTHGTFSAKDRAIPRREVIGKLLPQRYEVLRGQMQRHVPNSPFVERVSFTSLC